MTRTSSLLAASVLSVVSLSALDVALQRLGLRSAPDAGRGLGDRVHGARRLMRIHGVAVACQSGMFLLSLLVQAPR